MNIVMPFICGVRPTGLFFWSDSVVVCGRHKRGIALQPVTSWDQENEYGTGSCPFCLGGPLHRQYHKFRSQKRLSEALDKLTNSLRRKENNMPIYDDYHECFWTEERAAELLAAYLRWCRENQQEPEATEEWELSAHIISHVAYHGLIQEGKE